MHFSRVRLFLLHRCHKLWRIAPESRSKVRVNREPSDSGRMERKRRVKWPSMAEDGKWNDFDEDVVLVLENTLKGSSKEKLDAIGRVDIFHR